MPNRPNDDTRTTITVQVSDKRKQTVNEISHEQSSPGQRVIPSEVVREAIQDYIEKFEQDPEECAPCDRGALGFEPATDQETGDA